MPRACVHTDEVVASLNPEIVAPERVRVLDGRKEKERHAR